MSGKFKLVGTILLLSCLVQARNLQTVYDAIIIGSGAAGIGAAVTLASKNLNFIILEARNRTGGRTYATTLSNVPVDLGASFVHNPETNNAINTYVQQLNWGKTLANFSVSEILYQTGNSLNTTEEAQAKTVFQGFSANAQSQVSNGVDIDIQSAWNTYKASVVSSYSEKVINRAYFELLLEANLNGADPNTVSTLAYVSTSGKSTYDYLPATSYGALIQAIYNSYCKNAQIILNQAVKTIDYSGSVVKISTSSQSYYANKVINTVPLGCLKNNDITFVPELPASYKTAISSIGMGIFNKIIVTLNDTIWENNNTRVVDMPFPINTTTLFPEFYLAPTTPSLLLFFLSGNNSAALNLNSDTNIISALIGNVSKYTSKSISASNYTITRWEQQIYSRGSYSYYKVGTTSGHFTTLRTPINNRLWFAGQHVHPNQSSNAHGAFQTGIWAGALSGLWQLVGRISLLLLLV